MLEALATSGQATEAIEDVRARKQRVGLNKSLPWYRDDCWPCLRRLE